MKVSKRQGRLTTKGRIAAKHERLPCRLVGVWPNPNGVPQKRMMGFNQMRGVQPRWGWVNFFA
jgi:hypothetical protein